MAVFMFTKPLSAAKIAQQLGRSVGARLRFTEGNDVEDGEIWVTPAINVQVGGDYLIVNYWPDDETMWSWPARRTLREIAPDLDDALRRAEECHVRL